MSEVHRTPTNRQIMEVITKLPIRVTLEEARDDEISMTAEDYDDCIKQAFIDICSGRIQAGEDPKKVEHPHDRLHRIGRESIQA